MKTVKMTRTEKIEERIAQGLIYLDRKHKHEPWVSVKALSRASHVSRAAISRRANKGLLKYEYGRIARSFRKIVFSQQADLGRASQMLDCVISNRYWFIYEQEHGSCRLIRRISDSVQRALVFSWNKQGAENDAERCLLFWIGFVRIAKEAVRPGLSRKRKRELDNLLAELLIACKNGNRNIALKISLGSDERKKHTGVFSGLNQH